jgi:hypothetical protein
MEIRYARSGEVEIAYRTLGTGPLTLVYVGRSFSNLEVMWEHSCIPSRTPPVRPAAWTFKPMPASDLRFANASSART